MSDPTPTDRTMTGRSFALGTIGLCLIALAAVGVFPWRASLALAAVGLCLCIVAVYPPRNP